MGIHSKRLMAASVVVAAAGIFGVQAQRANAITIYATVQNASNLGTLNAIDTSTNTPTLIYTAATGGIDSLVFDGNGNVILTEDNAGSVVKLNNFNPATNTYSSATTVISGLLDYPQDIALEPAAVSLAAGLPAGHTSVLVAEYSQGTIDRIDTNATGPGALTRIPGGGGTNYGLPQGLVYVGNNLYATIGTPNAKRIAQINPITGAIVTDIGTGKPNETPVLGDNDGLTYDTFTGKLYSADRANDSVWTGMDPTQLDNYTPGTLFDLPLRNPGTPIEEADGIASDGQGNLFVAGFDQGIPSPGPGNIYQYNFTTASIVASIKGVDDIAPMSGPGSTGSGVPEPASLTLLGLGAAGLFLRRRGKH